MIPLARPLIGDAEKTAVLAVLESGQLAEGSRVAELERRFAALCGVRHAVATSSGTAALHLALLANGIGPGDEVVTTPFSFAATVNAILMVGARPVFVDVDPVTFNLDASPVEAAITTRTRALLPVHLFGQTCDMPALAAIAERHGLRLIEDACQAVGATCHGRAAGSFGTGVFSLYATKNVTAGEGGIVTTDDDSVAERCRLLRNHGMRRRNEHECLGFNYRLSDLHAAIGLAQLGRLDELTRARQRNAAYLGARIGSVVIPGEQADFGHVWHQYTVLVDRDRDVAARQLAAAGVGTGVFYPTPLHRLPHVRAVVGDVSLPVAERLARSVLSLPVHPALTTAELDAIVAAVNGL
jgi:perosamine synthetase